MSSTPSEPEFTPRATCYACFRPQVLCYCDALPDVTSRTNVVIVQHPREQFHPINTARLVERSLSSCRVLRGNLARLDEEIARLELPSSAALLFPSRDSVDLSEIPESDKPSTVVVLDGTWHQAKVLLRQLPALAGLRRVRFTPDEPSEYRIRKEPKADYLSTLESVALVLETLEPGFDGEPIRNLFRHVIDENIAARRHDPLEQRFKRKGEQRSHRFPDVFVNPLARVVHAYAEGTPVEGEARREPLFVAFDRVIEPEDEGSAGLARAPRAGALKKRERLELWLETTSPPGDRLLEHLGTTRSAYESARVSRSVARELIESWRSEAASTTIDSAATVLAWNSTTISILCELGLTFSSHQLKGSYCSLKRYRDEEPENWGGISDAVRREGLELSGDADGRGAQRLEETWRLADWLRNQALAG